MNREILFRGKRVDGKGWEFGCLIESFGELFIGNTVGNHPENWCQIIPETVGQFTGLTDKNGTKIFEGDRYKTDSWPKVEYTVKFLNGSFCGGTEKNGYDPLGFSIDQDSETIELDYFASTVEITSNIHDNPTP